MSHKNRVLASATSVAKHLRAQCNIQRLERQREGIAKAKAEGKYMGRKPTARAKSDEVKALAAEGLGPVEIAAPSRFASVNKEQNWLMSA